MAALKLHVPVDLSRDDIEFDHKDIIGVGGQGFVVKGKFKKAIHAIKVTRTTTDGPADLKEVAVLAKCSHGNIIQLIGVCQQPPTLYIVMEYFKSHTLEDAIFDRKIAGCLKLSLERKHQILFQVTNALSYLHTENSTKPIVVHGDIKPHNVLSVNWKWIVKY